MAMKQDLQHVVSDAPRVMVVDGSRLVRKLIGDTLLRDLPNAEVIGCGGLEEARAVLANGVVDLVTTALVLPDGDGLALARMVRETAGQAYVPVIVVSGNAQEALETRAFTEDITDYFDKGLGHGALAAFIRGYVQPAPIEGARVLYVEDSKVVALATRRMLEKYGLKVTHVVSVEDALALVETAQAQGNGPGFDLVLTDVYLKGGLTGKELLEHARGPFAYSKGLLPILVMTADDNPANQAALLRAGANDLVSKPVEERLLITKLLFQLRVGKSFRKTQAVGA